MSLILEALRKSEAERRRGLAPDVAMELPPTPASRPRALAAWLLPALVVAGLLVLAGWWARREPAEPASPPEAIETVGPAGVPRIESAPDTPVAATGMPTIEAPAPTMQEPAPFTTPLPEPPASATTPAASVAAAPPAPIPPKPVQPMPAQPVAPIQAPPARPLPPPPSDISDDTSMLPPIKLSMHMWDEAPARRFVILNGQRMAEGDRYSGITVVTIERSGVVVESNGTRARVPLP